MPTPLTAGSSTINHRRDWDPPLPSPPLRLPTHPLFSYLRRCMRTRGTHFSSRGNAYAHVLPMCMLNVARQRLSLTRDPPHVHTHRMKVCTQVGTHGHTGLYACLYACLYTCPYACMNTCLCAGRLSLHVCTHVYSAVNQLVVAWKGMFRYGPASQNTTVVRLGERSTLAVQDVSKQTM